MMVTGRPAASRWAMTENVVPRSIPTGLIVGFGIL
jgi:hypothetical protein